MALLFSLKDMLLDKDVTADGRDNAISLIAKNVPRQDLRRGNNARTMTFLEIGGILHERRSIFRKRTQKNFTLIILDYAFLWYLIGNKS